MEVRPCVCVGAARLGLSDALLQLHQALRVIVWHVDLVVVFFQVLQIFLPGHPAQHDQGLHSADFGKQDVGV